jgi:hypothetical protein
MNMKKLILLVALIGFTFSVQAQKKGKMDARVKTMVDYIAQKMNLNEEKTTFLYDTMLANTKESMQKKKTLTTKEEKKQVNKEMHKKLRQDLSEKFSKEEIDQIFALMKEKRQLDKQGKQGKSGK